MDLSRKSLSDPQDVIVVSKWVAAISVAPHTEEVARNVVDTLMQLAHNPGLRKLIPAHVWLWLNERPSLPPAYKRHWRGGDFYTVWTIRALNNIEILTSYLILVWSEWNPLYSNGFAEIQMSLREDFEGIGMGRHRAELIQQLDYILGELDRRSRRLDVNFEDDELWQDKLGRFSGTMKDEYGEFKKILEEVDQEATEILNHMLHNFSMFHNFISLGLLSLTDLHRITLHLHVCPASPVSVISHLERSTSRDEPLYSRSTSSFFPRALLADLEQSQFCLDIEHSFLSMLSMYQYGNLLRSFVSRPRFVSSL
jgi:hypothetical protein